MKRFARRLRLAGNERGAAAVEMAFAIPVFIMMIWAFVQFAQMFRALAGIQQALGQGARYATLCLNPSVAGCNPPSPSQIQTKITDSVYGIGPGTFTVASPVQGSSGTGSYYDLSVSYSQPTSLLLLPGPTLSVTRSKRVWVAGT
ncbi:pilus assembly protein [Sphingomonas ginkgonis]|uniref:Pilus assembly protein n=1 Tax=Sphingomonas ginkgonis TaxID=2315330 RepID=A0A429VA52_9SPHN|nr:TadE/TadG family type IV pilus assembly protein [Sphingomonas ginkgonis]RST30870.1 pilus assembly protein [Sphingomonas ginkgonis]